MIGKVRGKAKSRLWPRFNRTPRATSAGSALRVWHPFVFQTFPMVTFMSVLTRTNSLAIYPT